MNTRRFNMIVAGALTVFGLCACDDETTAVPDSPAMSVLESGKKMDGCSKDNAGEMVYVSDSAAVFYCAEGEWQILNGKDGENGADGQGGSSGRDTVVVNQKDTIVVVKRDTVFMELSSTGIGSSSSKTNSSSSVADGRSSSSHVTVAPEGSFVDSRDGRAYKTVQIGPQVWMAENLKLDVNGAYCYNDAKANCEKYGMFYTSATATRVCPEGWKLPTESDWKTLAMNLGIENWSSGDVYTYQGAEAVLKIKSTSGWIENNGTDALGFSAFPVGQFTGTKYTGFGETAYFMGPASGGDGEYAYITADKIVATGERGLSSTLAMPVRCMLTLPCNSSNQGEILSKFICDGSEWRIATLDELYGVCDDATDGKISSDEIFVCSRQNWHKMSWLDKKIGACSSKNDGEKKDGYTCMSGIWFGKLADSRDNQVYNTVAIGSMTWMGENLNHKGGNCNTNGCKTYGRYYTWAAAMDSAGIYTTNGKGCGYASTCSPTGTIRGICPEGWHLPNTMEWQALYVAMVHSPYAMQAIGFDKWTDATDAYGFSALPAGWYRGGTFNDVGSNAYFWSGSGYDSRNANYWYLDAGGARLGHKVKYDAISVRCVQD